MPTLPIPTLLVVNDEPNVLYSLERRLQSDTLRIITAGTASQGIELVRAEKPDAMLLDVRLPDMSGLDAFEEIRHIDPRLPVIIMTAHAATDTAIEAMKRGAFEYLLKPVDLRELREVVSRALELSRLMRVPAVIQDGEQPSPESGDRIVGRSPLMQEVYKAIGRVSTSDVNVLILGESGTGKELVARAIYQHSRRGDRPFLAVNCAAIPETLLESELFGHEKGAFTGAERRRIGKFEQAHGGTIFLDEIGDMTTASQAKILRVLQDQRFERVGGNETIQTDARVIAATNQNLEELVSQGRFRQDLYHRLKVFSIYLPPLRQRLEDLPRLVDHFVHLYNTELGKQVRAVSAETMLALESYSWWGNVRELQSVIKYALISARGEVLTPDCLPESCRGGSGPSPLGGAGIREADQGLEIRELARAMLQGGETDLDEKLRLAVDRVALEEVLRHVQGNQVEASRILGISRTTLRARLRAAGMAVEKQVLAETDQAGEKVDNGTPPGRS